MITFPYSAGALNKIIYKPAAMSCTVLKCHCLCNVYRYTAGHCAASAKSMKPYTDVPIPDPLGFVTFWPFGSKFGFGSDNFYLGWVGFGHTVPDPAAQDKNYFLWIISDGTTVKAHRNRQLSSGHKKRRRTFSLLKLCSPSSDSPMSIIVSVVSSSSDSTSSSRSPSTSSSSSVPTWCPTKTACPRIIWNTGEHRYWNDHYYYLILLENTLGNHLQHLEENSAKLKKTKLKKG